MCKLHTITENCSCIPKWLFWLALQLAHEFWFQKHKIVNLFQHLISTVSAMVAPAFCPQVFEAVAELALNKIIMPLNKINA